MAFHFIILIIVFPLLGAFLSSLFGEFSKKARNFLLVSILLLTNIFSFILYKLIIEKGAFVYSLGAKFPSLASPDGFPVRIILTVDALSGFLALIFLLIASLTLLYSWETLKKYSSLDKFYALYLMLIVGILGILFSGDFFTLFVFYEINSIATTGLITFFRNKECFKAAFHYLAVFAVSSLFLLLGVSILYGQYGFLNMAVIAHYLQFSFLDKIALSLIGSALLLKAGLFPFYFWKPETYKASSVPAIILFIISSLSGVYALFRIAFDVFGLNIVFGWILILFSILSIFTGVFFALKEDRVKRILAYLAVSELGYIILGISSGFLAPNADFGFRAIQGGLFHIVNDALDVSLLFLIIGVIIYISKVKNIFEIRGLAHKKPFLSGLFLLGVLAVSGMPPLNGFASKIIIFESVFRLNPALAIAAILGSILILAVLIKVFASIFLGEPTNRLQQRLDLKTKNYQPVPKLAIIVISIFAMSMVLIGFFPKQFVNSFINPAAKALISRQSYINNVLCK